MLKAELLKSAKQKLVIQNYSQRTIASYLSAINSFASWLIEEKVAQVSYEIVENDWLIEYLSMHLSIYVVIITISRQLFRNSPIP